MQHCSNSDTTNNAAIIIDAAISKKKHLYTCPFCDREDFETYEDLLEHWSTPEEKEERQDAIWYAADNLIEGLAEIVLSLKPKPKAESETTSQRRGKRARLATAAVANRTLDQVLNISESSI